MKRDYDASREAEHNYAEAINKGNIINPFFKISRSSVKKLLEKYFNDEIQEQYNIVDFSVSGTGDVVVELYRNYDY